jgi:fibronectin type 3 domain-containing protein
VTLSPQQAVTLQVKFAPTSTSSATGTLTVSSNVSTIAVNLSGTGSQHQVNLSWQAPGNSPVTVSGYNIYRATGNSSSYQLLNSSIDTQTTYVDSSVQSGTVYTYYVESVSSSGTASDPSSSASVTIP